MADQTTTGQASTVTKHSKPEARTDAACGAELISAAVAHRDRAQADGDAAQTLMHRTGGHEHEAAYRAYKRAGEDLRDARATLRDLDALRRNGWRGIDAWIGQRFYDPTHS